MQPFDMNNDLYVDPDSPVSSRSSAGPASHGSPAGQQRIVHPIFGAPAPIISGGTGATYTNVVHPFVQSHRLLLENQDSIASADNIDKQANENDVFKFKTPQQINL